MRAQQKESPVIGGPSVCVEPSTRDGEYQDLWKHYEPKVKKMASQFYIQGAVGAEHEDLVQIGQQMLLHCLRKHDASRTKFSTYYYSCLRNEYLHLLKRCFPKKRYIVVSYHPETQEREMFKCSGADLEPVLLTLRSGGKTYMVIPKSRSSRYPMMENLTPIDHFDEKSSQSDTIEGEFEHEVGGIASILASPETPLSVDDIIERIKHRIPDEEMRQMAIWLFEGHKMRGPNGIMKRLGLKKHQVERHMQRIRMLLAGEFGLAVARPMGA